MYFANCRKTAVEKKTNALFIGMRIKMGLKLLLPQSIKVDTISIRIFFLLSPPFLFNYVYRSAHRDSPSCSPWRSATSMSEAATSQNTNTHSTGTDTAGLTSYRENHQIHEWKNIYIHKLWTSPSYFSFSSQEGVQFIRQTDGPKTLTLIQDVILGSRFVMKIITRIDLGQ